MRRSKRFVWRVAPGRLAGLGPAGGVLATAVSLWLIGGVRIGQVATFLAYQALFVLGPGLLVYRALGGRGESRLRQLVFGWTLGYVLEIGAFMVTAALGARPWLVAYPLAAAALALAIGRRRRQPALAERPAPQAAGYSVAWMWAVAGICALALCFVAIEYFATAPLPDHVDRVAYGLDQVWNLSLAAEAKHHWPVSDPTAVGTPLFYHLFASFDVAATSQVTGLPLPVVFFRLYLVPLVVLVALGLSLAGAAIGRGRWAGPLAAVLVLFVGELNVDPHVGYVFANELGDDLFAISPSFLLGLVFFVPVLLLLHERCGTSAASRWDWRRWSLLALLLFGCAGAKATTLPVLIGGLALYVVWRRVRGGGDRGALAALGLAGAVYLLSSLIEYGGAGSYGLALHVPGAIRQMAGIAHFAHALPSAGAATAFWALAIPVGLVGAYGASLLGLRWAFKRGDAPAPPGHALLLGLLLSGLAPYLLFTHFGLSQVFFAEYGLVAACLLSADGLDALWSRASRRARGRLLAFALAWAALLLATALGLPRLLSLSQGAAHSAYFHVAAALALAATVALGAGLRAHDGARRALPYALAAILVTGATGKALGVAAPTATRLAHGEPLYSQTGNSLTSGLRRGLTWIRDHTAPSAVVAVNNYRDGSLYWDYGWKVPDDYYYSALAERRIFLEGWIYAQRAFDLGERDVFLGRKIPFPARLAINEALFQHADSAALRTMSRRYGVQYLLVDRVHNYASPQLSRLARTVFADPDVAIYAVNRERAQRPRLTAARERPRLLPVSQPLSRNPSRAASGG